MLQILGAGRLGGTNLMPFYVRVSSLGNAFTTLLLVFENVLWVYSSSVLL